MGVLAAIVSAMIVFGSLALSMAEGNVPIAFLPSETPTSTLPIPTQKPGEPTYTPTPTPVSTSTPTMITPSGLCQTPPGWMQVTVEIGEDWESRPKIWDHSGCLDCRQLHRWINGRCCDLGASFTPHGDTNRYPVAVGDPLHSAKTNQTGDLCSASRLGRLYRPPRRYSL